MRGERREVGAVVGGAKDAERGSCRRTLRSAYGGEWGRCGKGLCVGCGTGWGRRAFRRVGGWVLGKGPGADGERGWVGGWEGRGENENEEGGGEKGVRARTGDWKEKGERGIWIGGRRRKGEELGWEHSVKREGWRCI